MEGRSDTIGSHQSTVGLLEESAPYLWIVAILFFGVGDLATTLVGLTTGRAAEAGPLVALLVEQYGLGTLLALKPAAIGICYLMYRFVPAPYAVGTPLGLAVLGVLITGWNVGVLLVSFL